MKKKKVLVIGIDGLPFSTVNQLCKQQILPNLNNILSKGQFRRMNSTIPEVSSTAWTTCMTGVNPGRHGIFGFMDFEKNSYKIYFPDSASIKAETLWDVLGRHGLKSIVINVPSTYPAKKMNGILTAGFVAIDLQKATYPDSAYQYLKNMGYRLDVDSSLAFKSMSDFIDDVFITFEKRKEAILHLLNDEWDLFIGTITETDRLHHFLWSALKEGMEFSSYFHDFYKNLDSFIGKIYEKMTERHGDALDFIIVSDHGFTDIQQEIYINSYLRENGYLSFKNFPPKSMEEIHPSSKAFALDPSRIYINRKNRFPGGCVDEAEYKKLRLEIKEAFMKLEYMGKPVIKNIFFKEELYVGPCFEQAPDIVLLSHHGFDLKGAIGKDVLFGRSIFTGSHTRDDAVFFINNNSHIPEVVDIADVMPTILNLYGIQTNNLDGKVLIDKK